MCDPFLRHNLISVCTFATRLPQRHGFLFDDCDKEQFVFMTVRLNSWCFLYTPLPCFSFVPPFFHFFTFSLFISSFPLPSSSALPLLLLPFHFLLFAFLFPTSVLQSLLVLLPPPFHLVSFPHFPSLSPVFLIFMSPFPSFDFFIDPLCLCDLLVCFPLLPFFLFLPPLLSFHPHLSSPRFPPSLHLFVFPFLSPYCMSSPVVFLLIHPPSFLLILHNLIFWVFSPFSRLFPFSSILLIIYFVFL